MKRDGAKTSIWQDSPGAYRQERQGSPGIDYDVIVVGGGITGLSTALRLQEAGRRCMLAEAHVIGFGTTGGTTAHLNTFYDTPYYQAKSDFGKDGAQLLCDGAHDAISLIYENIQKHQIDCNFERKQGFLFSLDEKQKDQLEKIVESAREVGVEIDFTNNSPFPIPYLTIASVENQAQFNPALYIQGLAKAFQAAGGVLLENCRVTSVSDDQPLKVSTSQGDFTSKQLVYATHIPPGVNILHFRCAPYRSYAIAFTLKGGEYPEAVGYDLMDPYHYYRTQELNGKKYIIAGGEDHKTGHEENTDKCLLQLEAYVRGYYDVDEVVYRWSSQYFEPADGLAYIGHLPGNPEQVYVATGFGGNGMIYGSLSAIILSDLIITGESKYRKLFDPNRIKPIAGFASFVKESADVVAKFIGDKISVEKLTGLSDLAAGEARVVKYEGHTLALYRDEEHQLHAVNSACTHVKCTVAWNKSEMSWDCPCHGSRFSFDGEVLTGPARRDLEKIDLLKIANA